MSLRGPNGGASGAGTSGTQLTAAGSATDPMLETPPVVEMSREEIEATVPLVIREDVAKTLTGYRNGMEEIKRLISVTVTEKMSNEGMHRFKAIVISLYDVNIPLPLVRNVFGELCKAMMAIKQDIDFMSLSTTLMAIHHQMSSNQHNHNSRSYALEFNLIEIRQRMSYIYQLSSASSQFVGNPSRQNNCFFEAATVLSRIPIEALSELSDNGFSINVRISYLLIQAGSVELADNFLGRATSHLNNEFITPADRLQHRVCLARILDLKRRFEDAAHRYYILAIDSSSFNQKQQPKEEDSSSSHLIHAITCAILAPAGPRRSRLLAMLYNDDRSKQLDIYPLLQSIHMGRLLQKHHVDRLRPTLQPHQLKTHPDGDTVLDHAIIEHNMLAISRMYSNIGLGQLANLLNVSPEKAEKTARVMINEKRMIASIDQVEHMLQFSSQSATANIQHWDNLIASLCAQVDDCVDSIVQKHALFATNSFLSTPTSTLP